VTAALRPTRPAGPAAGRPPARRRPRFATAARDGAVVAIAASLALALWELRAQLAGESRVERFAAATVDGGTVGRALAVAIWGALAIALVAGVLARRSARLAAGSEGIAAARPAIEPASGRKAGLPWPAALGLALVVGVYHLLLLPGAITWGDWGYFANAGAVRSFFPFPSLWSYSTLGSDNILGASIAPIDSLMGGMARLGFSYPLLERLFFYYPAVVLSYLGALGLARRLGADWAWAAGAGVLFATNPYTLAIISGGQLTIGMGLVLYPFVALAALRLWSRRSVSSGVLLGVVLGAQAWFDPRTAGLSVAGLVAVSLALLVGDPREVLRRAPWLGGAVAVAIFVAFQGPWLLPALFAVRAQLPASYTTPAALQTFSLMSLADGLSLFHPFWPTMHFIALHSVPALWLVVPVAVALALFHRPTDPLLHAGVTLYLVFAALVSGANAPFGALNTWLFLHVPGMDLFRDPSPYSGPLALGLVVVCAGSSLGAKALPCPDGAEPAPEERVTVAAAQEPSGNGAGWRGSGRAPDGRGAFRSSLSIAGVVGLVMLVVSGWPALSGTLRHALAPRTVPLRYRTLDRELLSASPGAVLWVPTVSRFAPVSPAHPNVSAVGLELDSAAGFPAPSTPLDWLAAPGLLGSLLSRYHIATVVIRTGPSSYQVNSLAYPATPAVAVRDVEAIRGVSHRIVGGIVVVSLPGRSTYPGTVFRSAPAPSHGQASASGSARAVLSVTSVGAGLGEWGPVGDGNNYLHQSLDAAGIAASLQRVGGSSWLHLTVRYGSAVVAHTLATCPKPGILHVGLRYRTTGGGSASVTVFTAAQSLPVAQATFPGTSGRWVRGSTSVVLAPAVSVSAAGRPLASCAVELSAWPGVAGVASSLDVRSLVVAEPGVGPSLAEHALSAPGGGWGAPTSPRGEEMSDTGATMRWEIPASATSQLAVFWQQFDPGWSARVVGSRTTLRHVEVDGWANGFTVPPSRRPLAILIRYEPQRLEDDGYAMLAVGLGLAGTLAVASLVRRRLRAERSSS